MWCAAGETFARPLDGVGEDDEADQGVAAGLGEDGVLACGVGEECSGGGGFGGVVDGEAGPEAVGVVAHVERVADEREGEERDCSEGEDGGDGGGGVFFVGVDGALRGDDGGDSADAGADGEQGGEFRAEVEGAAQPCHEGDGEAKAMKTRMREIPPSLRMSPRMKRAPSRMMPALSQNS